ncbi:hypothetical protein [Pseudomonas atacamensis]|uniref:hypothetical protein n=1 Tax=Pseudomonas atacamensis TaxID=2565368 RepID=UPI00300F553C
MIEVDREVLKEAVAGTVAIMSKNMPNSFYDAGVIIMPYFIHYEAKHGALKKKAHRVTVTEIQRELEWMIKSGEIEKKFSWLDPKAIEEREKRIQEMDAKYRT